MTLRLGTYNLLDGGGDRWPKQVDFLASLELDVLGLQEAKHWDRDGFSRMFETARALKMQPLFAPSASHGCHLITLYRWPRVQCAGYAPDVGEGNFHHTAARAKFIVDGFDLTIVHTHLDPFSGQDRLEEARWLTQYGAPGGLTVLMGDLNTEGLTDPPLDDWRRIPAHLHSRHRLVRPDGTYGPSDRRAIAALTAAGFVDPPVQLQTSPPRTVGYWYSDELWDHRSDHVLLSPGLAPALRSYDVVDTPISRALGDHLPVVTTIGLEVLEKWVSSHE